MADIKRAVRSAESSRTSSCDFADLVASMSIKFFRQHCPEELQQSYKQTVLASISIRQETAKGVELTILSIGVGTKVAPFESVASQTALPGGSLIVKDCHAEVLARRGLLKYLYGQLESAAREDANSIFECDQLDGDIKFVLKVGLSFHLYTSSQPCGNASIKRWAKTKPVQYQTTASALDYPIDKHARIQITESSRREGQTMLLVKRNLQPTATSSEDTPSATSNANTNQSVVDPALATAYIPTGTALPSSGFGNIMTCSDKIAHWNAVGLQGSLLSSFIAPVYLSTITVGRKFGKVHCERALCCRLQDFCHPVPSTTTAARQGGGKRSRPTDTALSTDEAVPGGVPAQGFRVHHPVMLGTAVKLDEGAIVTGPDPLSGPGPTSGPDPSCGPDPAPTGTTVAPCTASVEKETTILTAGSDEDAATASLALGTSTATSTGDASSITARAATFVGASFADPRCVCCYLHKAGEYVLEVIDGHTGLLVDSTAAGASTSTGMPADGSKEAPCGSGPVYSSVCSAALLKSFTNLCSILGRDITDSVQLSYAVTKRAVASVEYTAAKDHLRDETLLFGDWVRKAPL